MGFFQWLITLTDKSAPIGTCLTLMTIVVSSSFVNDAIAQPSVPELPTLPALPVSTPSASFGLPEQPAASSPTAEPAIQSPEQFTLDSFSAPSQPLPSILEGGLNTIVSDSYKLTNGDIISLWIANVPEYSTQFQVLGDGSVNLPVLGPVPLWGLTLEEAAMSIATRYQDEQILVEPVVEVILAAMSPLRVAIVGEIKRPGTYTLTPNHGEPPTLTSLVGQAGGITEKTNLDNVQIYRLTPNHRQREMSVSLWALLMTGDLSQDIPLQDGDTIVLAEATDIDFATAQQIASARFSSEVISINVMGEVASPGLVTVASDTTLNEILILAGGFTEQANKSKVALLSLNPDGSVRSRDVTVDFEAPVNLETNPLMQHRDILVIGKSTGSRTRDIVTTVREILRTVTSNPIDGLLSIFEFFF